MSEFNEAARTILLQRCITYLDNSHLLSSQQRSDWIAYRNALQDLDVNIENPIFPIAPAEPIYPLTVEQISERANAQIERENLRAEYQNMLDRLQQIQDAVNPTNAQVVQAVKDEALYITRIMKVLAKLIT